MNDVRDRLARLHVDLDGVLDDTRRRWKDVIADDFERWYWTGIDRTARDFLAACERFEDVLDRAENAVPHLN